MEPTQPITEAATAELAVLEKLLENAEFISDALKYVSGFCLFAVVVLLCYFSYKFFRIFF